MTELGTWEQRYPWIKWREPLPVKTTTGDSGYACRICIAERGLRGSDVKDLPKDPEQVSEHIRRVHDRELVNSAREGVIV